MEITTIVGLIAGILAVVGAMIFKGISFAVLLNPAAFFVIIIGTIATILNSYPGKDLKNLGKLFKILFTKENAQSEEEIIKTMIQLGGQARKEGLLSLEESANNLNDPFISKGVRLIVDGVDEEYIIGILGAEIEAMEERHENNASIFTSAGTYAPTLGVLGAVFGLIAAMSHIDDTAAMSEAIAAAFVATIMGIFTGYVLWHPFAKKLKMKSKHEVLLKRMIVEGLMSIQKGDVPLMIQDKLLSVLPPKKQTEIAGKLNLLNSN